VQLNPLFRQGNRRGRHLEFVFEIWVPQLGENFAIKLVVEVWCLIKPLAKYNAIQVNAKR
jgi:hypothetical protein